MDEQLIEDLTNYLEDDAETARMIPLSAERAIRSFKKKRNYPSSYSDEKINSDMENCYDCIFDLALFFLVKQGAEFQGSHSESSVNRSWNSETEIYVNHGVFPFIGF
mgnify:FL=1|nr:MAG TPA: hypothetical protein [Caudoviricetes sp.]